MNTLAITLVLLLFALAFGYVGTWLADLIEGRQRRKRTISVLDQYLIGRSIVRMK